jgi:hypothetical protein
MGVPAEPGLKASPEAGLQKRLRPVTEGQLRRFDAFKVLTGGIIGGAGTRH